MHGVSFTGRGIFSDDSLREVLSRRACSIASNLQDDLALRMSGSSGGTLICSAQKILASAK